jgi:putative phosphoesterase
MTDSGCIAVLSDAHGNVEALKLAFDTAKQFGAGKFIYLGDSLGYIPSVAALEFLRTSNDEIHFVKGNHEEALLKFRKNSDSDEITKHSIIQSKLSAEQVDFIRSWEEKVYIEYDSIRAMFIHGSPAEPLHGYLYKDSEVLHGNLNLDCKLLFVGNTHIPFIRKAKNVVVINVGSVGLPRDHGKMGSFAILNFDIKKVQIIRFPIGQIQEDLKNSYKSLIHNKVYEVFDRIAPLTVIEEFQFD